MRQLESSLNIDPAWWLKNPEKLNSAINVTLSLLPSDMFSDQVRTTALVALRTIIKNSETLPDSTDLINVITRLHLDSIQDIGKISMEILGNVVLKTKIQYSIQVLNKTIGDNDKADLNFGTCHLLECVCRHKKEDIAEHILIILPPVKFAASLFRFFCDGNPLLRKMGSNAITEYRELVGDDILEPIADSSCNATQYKLYKMLIQQRSGSRHIASPTKDI